MYKLINIVLGSHNRKDLPKVFEIGSILYFDQLEFRVNRQTVQGSTYGAGGKWKLYSISELERIKSQAENDEDVNEIDVKPL